MRRRLECLPPIVVLLATLCLGCGADLGIRGSPSERPIAPRPLVAESGGRWIGNAISYGPHRDGQRPGGSSPSAAEIREDLGLMLPHWNLLRIYGSGGIAETLLRIIREDGLDIGVMLGAWIAPDSPAANRSEVDEAIRLANAFPEIVLAVSVGNETQIYWSAHSSPLDQLIGHVRRVRSAVAQPVTVADDFNYWNKPESRALAAELDFVTMHAHPMWNGLELDAALPWLREQLATVRATHPGRAIVIGETGWATALHDEGEQARLIKGAAGEVEQARFHDDVRAWAAAEGCIVFFFEAFDENWKGGEHPDEVEKHWGLFRADRTAKEAIAPGAGTKPD